jgi:hypothetical protein
MRTTYRRNEDGAVLLLAVIFLIIMALVLVPLLGLAGNGLSGTITLITQQTIQKSASGAADIALENVQYTDLALPTNPAQPANCLPSSPVTPLAGTSPSAPQIWVTCSLGPSQTFGPWKVPGSAAYGPYTRQLYVYACQTASPVCGTPGSDQLLSAVVEIVDDATCTPSAVAGCGQQAIIESWLDSSS